MTSPYYEIAIKWSDGTKTKTKKISYINLKDTAEGSGYDPINLRGFVNLLAQITGKTVNNIEVIDRRNIND